MYHGVAEAPSREDRLVLKVSRNQTKLQVLLRRHGECSCTRRGTWKIDAYARGHDAGDEELKH